MGIRMGEGRSKISPVINYLNYWGCSESRNFVGGSGLIPYLVVFLVAVLCSWQRVYSRRMSFQWMPRQSKPSCQTLRLYLLILGASIIPNLQMRKLGSKEVKD